MSIGVVGSSYQQYSSISDNSSTIKNLEKVKENLVSKREEITNSDSEDKETQLQIIDAQIQQIEAQIQQAQNKQNGRTQNIQLNSGEKTLNNNGDEVRDGVITSASLKELIEKNKEHALTLS